jgi:hypothetical protein
MDERLHTERAHLRRRVLEACRIHIDEADIGAGTPEGEGSGTA